MRSICQIARSRRGIALPPSQRQDSLQFKPPLFWFGKLDAIANALLSDRKRIVYGRIIANPSLIIPDELTALHEYSNKILPTLLLLRPNKRFRQDHVVSASAPPVLQC